MKLETFLKLNKISAAEFGKDIGASRSAVSRWIKGERKPTRHMSEIVARTKGKVTANDFYAAA